VDQPVSLLVGSVWLPWGQNPVGRECVAAVGHSTVGRECVAAVRVESSW
jgi:hypothetical protein